MLDNHRCHRGQGGVVPPLILFDVEGDTGYHLHHKGAGRHGDAPDIVGVEDYAKKQWHCRK
jgi:hypothetical protein